MPLRLVGILVTLLFSIAFAACARPLPAFPALGSGRSLKDAEEVRKDFGFVASLRIPDMGSSWGRSFIGKHYCAGALVAKNVVVTAAHCVPEGWYPDVHVNRYNRDGLDQGRFEDFKVVEAIRHPKFARRSDGLYDYDAAVLILDGDSQFEPIPLQRTSECTSDTFCSMGRVNGWGWEQQGDFESGSEQMLPVDVDILAQEMCDSLVQPPPEAVLCALEKTNACQVDSGGPLISDGYLKGIASSSAGCGSDPIGMYTRILNIVDWVDEQIEKVQPISTQTSAAIVPEVEVQVVEQAADSRTIDFSSAQVSYRQNHSLFGVPLPSSRTDLDSPESNNPRVGVMVPPSACRFVYGEWQPEDCNG